MGGSLNPVKKFRSEEKSHVGRWWKGVCAERKSHP